MLGVACGSGDAQTLCYTFSGCVYSWGDGDYGKLGRGGNEGSKIPKKIDSLTGKGVTKLLCGSQFSVALTSQGHVYTWYVHTCTATVQTSLVGMTFPFVRVRIALKFSHFLSGCV